MLRSMLSATVVAISVLVIGGIASASAINQVIANPGDFPGQGTGVYNPGGILTAGDASNSGTNGYHLDRFFATPNSDNLSDSNYVNFAITAQELFKPFAWKINLVGFSPFDPQSTQPYEYFFTVSVVNDLPTGHHPIGPATFSLVNLDVGVQGGPFSGIQFDSNGPTPERSYASTPGYFLAANYQTLYFGGQNGGGGQFLPSDGAQTFNFRLDVPGGVGGNFFLTMTPNPEPTSLLLGAFALIGGVMMTRRRKNKAVGDVQPQV